ncbi:MAG: serine hydrolase [Hymenobacter sp.]
MESLCQARQQLCGARWFRADSSARFPLPVARGLWGSRRLAGYIYQQIGTAPLNAKPGYVYSDLSFYLYPELVQRRTGQPFAQFLEKEVYRPLGSGCASGRCTPRQLAASRPRSTTRRFGGSCCAATWTTRARRCWAACRATRACSAPATTWRNWRKPTPGAGATAASSSSTKLCWPTGCARSLPGNPRGLAFDRARPGADNTAPGASAGSFGHSGFTGTYFWVDL